ncbi:MAG TPA: phosphate ABC transporter substrate-binding protein PstS [Solirubrobacteraceae bacterium]|nr:phosphate ABC transporter substrate-binding protein PstS [Solirubrobacteraceae bacterium]
MHINRPIPTLAVIAATAVAAGFGVSAASSSAAGHLTGAGSSLVAPLVENVFAPDFQSRTSNAVTYGSVGSGAGITSISGKTVDFGASDAPLTSSQEAGCSGCIEIPWALAGTGLSYNLSGIAHVNLTGPVIANIFLGTITMWNDPQIQKLNKGETLPAEKITPVYRSDGSGDTYAFTSYLSKVSRAWASKVGFGTSVAFPAGTGGKGNSGVAAVVAATPGALGNNSWFYVRQAKLQAVAVQNSAGNYVLPYDPYVADAAAVVKRVPTLSSLSSSTADSIASALSIVDPPYVKPKKGKKPTTLQKEAAAAYPISTFTYVILRPDNSNIGLLKQFIAFALSKAEQRKGGSLQFAPLPSVVASADAKAVNGL